MSLAYMEKIFSRCSIRKNKDGKISRNRINAHQRVVIAEGLDPVSINGEKQI